MPNGNLDQPKGMNSTINSIHVEKYTFFSLLNFFKDICEVYIKYKNQMSEKRIRWIKIKRYYY